MAKKHTLLIDWGSERDATAFKQGVLMGDEFEVQQDGGKLTITADARFI